MLNFVLFGPSAVKKRIIKKFADLIGLIYLGKVDQHSDDSKIIRGFTISATHNDDHYCVGTSDGYNISIVNRTDALMDHNGTLVKQSYLIMAIELHTKVDLPHFFIMPKNHDDKPFLQFFQTFHTMSQIYLGAIEKYYNEFTDKYLMFSRQSMSIQLQRLINASTASIIGMHFWPLAIEQNEHVLYIYSTTNHVDGNLLKVMYENGLWLAGQIDYQAELV